MMTNLLIGGAVIIGILVALGGAFRGYHADKVEASKADEAKQTTNQKTAQSEGHEDVVKARISGRLFRRWWRSGQTGVPPLPPALDPKPNRPTQS